MLNMEILARVILLFGLLLAFSGCKVSGSTEYVDFFPCESFKRSFDCY